MTAPGDLALDDLPPDQAPPMTNGEVVFEAPWQGRVFGMARAMAAAGVFRWDDFRARLIDELARAERNPDGTPFAYYDHFLRALEGLLVDRGLVDAGRLGERLRAFRERPADHDHEHTGGHHHPGHHHHHGHHEHEHDHGAD